MNDVARIPTRSERRAMDWSLVLASQGIQAVIENDPEAGWLLLVPVEEYERAKAAIAQYRRENVRWPWQQRVASAGTIFDWASALWVVLTWIFFQFETTLPGWRDAGVVDSGAVTRGEWWRLFTAELLHADALHLATNGVFGFLLLGLAMGRFGTGLGLFAAYLAGAAGNYFSLLAHPGAHQGLGASGVVMGALGLLAAQSVRGLRGNWRAWKIALGGLAAGVMLFVLLGTSPSTDVAAHLGGFVAGVAFGAVLALAPTFARRPAPNLIAGMVFAAMVIWPWLLALRAR